VNRTEVSGQDLMVDFCEDGSEFHGSTKIGNIYTTKSSETETPHKIHFIDKYDFFFKFKSSQYKVFYKLMCWLGV